MKDFEHTQDEVIDLGQASAETKGAVGFYIDASGGQLVNSPGLLDE
ncbi:MAG TPA: hypothetical protein DHV64_12935 [Erythrobacter sp.]|jgi:hypothetical protein|nr:benenodin family lasso peptide [Erythrobacter sp. SAORIC-644]HCJ22404.1 hypothetical protein [Erythrobacter sp.]|tara:strand:+ start:307 stop:444 length:138 start_codon:yes stop_codon:yes gene_type:complete